MTSADLNWVAPHIKLNPPESFYRDVPTKSPATFSTKGGKLAKRPLPNPAPPVLIRSNVDDDIRSMATSLRQEFPGVVRDVKKPTSWHELHNYFDATDLWYEGASFLFYVLNHIGNENIVLNHELEESKNQEISDWAKLWVEANGKRIMCVPPGQDLISIFDEYELESIHGLEPRQKSTLRQELNTHRKAYELLLVSAEDPRMEGQQQSFQQVHQPDHSYNPNHNQMSHRQPMTQPGMPAMHPGPQISGSPYPMPVDESRRNQMIPMQPMQPMQPLQSMQPIQSMQSMQPMNPPPGHIPFNMLMENRGQVPFMPQPPGGSGDFRQDGASYWGRQRGYSNELSRNSRGRGNANFNNYSHRNRSNFPANDRRMVANNATPRGSHVRRPSQGNAPSQGAIYVHNPRRQSPQFDGDATPRANGRSMTQNNSRIVSDPSNDHTPFSNDARFLRLRAPSKSQDVPDIALLRPPFEGHPQAFIMDNGERGNCTFWYQGEARKPHEFRTTRTLYVQNFNRDDFESHRLRDRFEKFGKVEFISYLFSTSHGDGGPAFVTYVNEGCRDAAIAELNGCNMPDGRCLVVNAARRDRAGSQSSEYGYEPYHSSDTTRDNYYRHNSHRGSVRNPSTSYRESDYSTRDRGSSTSSTSNTPLTVGFQAQLRADQPLAMQDATGALHSSLAEVAQHQVAINRFSNQNQIPLGNIENYPNAYNKENNRTHGRSFSNTGVDQPRMLMSQGSYNRKENTPMKKNSTKNTPLTSPKKDLPQGEDNNQKGGCGKKNKKGNRQNSSARPSRAPSPVKCKFQDALFAAMEAQQNHRVELSAVEKVDEETPITDKQKETPPQSDLTKVLAPTADEKASPIAEPKQLNSDNSTTKTTTDDAKVDSLVKGVGGLGLDISETNTEIANQVQEVPTLEVNPTIDPTIASTKPTIEVTQLATKDDSAIEKTMAAVEDASKSEASEIAAGLNVESQPTKKNSSKKYRKRKSAAKSDGGHSSNSFPSRDSSETLQSFFMVESTEHFVTAQSSPNPSITSGPSEPCVCTDDPTKSIAAGDTTISTTLENRQQPIIMHSKTDSNATIVSTPQSTIKYSKQRRQAHSKNGSSSSTSSTGSVRKADQKPPQLGKLADKNSKPEGKDLSEVQKEKSNPSSPAVNFEDSMQWPALAPPKTPITDCKPPAFPTIQPLSERKKNPNALIVPAVPLNMQRRRSP